MRGDGRTWRKENNGEKQRKSKMEKQMLDLKVLVNKCNG